MRDCTSHLLLAFRVCFKFLLSVITKESVTIIVSTPTVWVIPHMSVFSGEAVDERDVDPG